MTEDIKTDSAAEKDVKSRGRMDRSSNFCVCCGIEIPEGSLVCVNCLAYAEEKSFGLNICKSERGNSSGGL